MKQRRPRFRPIGAFGLTLLFAGLYFCCALLLFPLHVGVLSEPLGHAFLIWLPAALCGLAYSMIVFDSSPRLPRVLRTAVASTLAPSLALAFVLFVGFAWLGWKM